MRVLTAIAFAALVCCPWPQRAGAAPASAASNIGSRYAIQGGSVRPDGERSVSGRYNLSGGVTARASDPAPVPAKGERYAAKSTLAPSSADCSDVLLADSYE